MPTHKAIDMFWHWFQDHHYKYLFLNQVEEDVKKKLLDDLLVQLHRYCEHLYFEIGGHAEDKKMELVITAGGMIEYFPHVEALIDNAPEMDDWRFIKFKQPQGPGVLSEFGGKVFDPDKIILVPLTNKHNPSAVGVKICYSDYTEEEHETFALGTCIMLDTLIGEHAAALDIDYLEVALTPENINDFDFMHVSEIGAYIDQLKQK